MTQTYAMIMAGGVGSRFWPLSRRERPKQLLPLAGGERSLLQATVDRIAPICGPEHVLILTSELLEEAVAEALPNVPAENILAEPVGRNTAPCIAWGTSRVRRHDPDALCMVLPADHHIADEPAYLEVLSTALAAAEAGSVVTVGIRPTRPETGYGYLEVEAEVSPGVRRAARFVEKPDRERAEQFLEAGSYLWNSGMFFFRAGAMLEAVNAHLPELGAEVTRWLALDLPAEAQRVTATYGELPSVSIDHGVMEKLDEVLVVPGSFGWSDLGSFASVWELADKDRRGNRAPASAILVDTGNTFVDAPAGKRVAVIGVEDLVVVDSGDALLIMPRDRAQDVKKVVLRLALDGADDLL